VSREQTQLVTADSTEVVIIVIALSSNTVLHTSSNSSGERRHPAIKADLPMGVASRIIGCNGQLHTSSCAALLAYRHRWLSEHGLAYASDRSCTVMSIGPSLEAAHSRR
jgi:hypothetical protein